MVSWLLALSCCTPLATDARPWESLPPFLLRERGGISNTFAKLAAGEAVTIGYLGASVTNGAGASSEATKWRNLTFAWFQEQFPAAELTQIHQVSGGTGAQLGAARVGREYLNGDPDLMFVEFAVNDAGQPYPLCIDTMEGIVRQILAHDPTTDIVFVYTLNQSTLKDFAAGHLPSTIAAHEQVAEHYDIPTVNAAWAAARKLIANEITWEQFSIDTVHPTDLGYRIYADLVIEGLHSWARRGTVAPHPMPAPLSPTNWSQARLVPLTDCTLSAGWGPVEEDLQKRYAARFPGLRKASAPGETITFSFRGTDFGIYDLVGPDSGQLEVTIDGQRRPKPVPRWDRHSEKYIRPTMVMLGANLPPGVHEVELRISEERQEKSTGTTMRICDLILNGELVE